MKVIVTGARGQLGQTLRANAPAGMNVLGVDLPDLDIAEELQVRAFVDRNCPDIIINCAAFTAVDLAESSVDEAARVNGRGPEVLATVAREFRAKLIHISTDFVFDGNSSRPYSPNDPTNPLSTYGSSKWKGEQNVREILPEDSVVLRTSWLYSEYGGNFVSTMLRLFGERDRISVVDDQVGSPTWTRSVATAIFGFASMPEYSGTYHWADSGQTSWFGFACAIQEEALELGLIDRAVEILPITSDEYVTAAKRPTFSVLDCSDTTKALGGEAPPWRQSLRAMLEVIAK